MSVDIKTNIKKFEPKTVVQTEEDTGKKFIDLRSLIQEPDEKYEVGNPSRYNVVKARKANRFGKTEIKYYILEKGCPVFQINEWLDLKNDKETTGKKYAYILNRFLNYLDSRGKKYYDVTVNDVTDYVLYRMYGGEDNVTLIKSKIRYKTISDDVTVIKMLYKWLATRIGRVILETTTKEVNHFSSKSYLFAEVGLSEYEQLIEKHLDSMPDTKQYKKWYTEEEIDAIASNFKTLRDKVIFLCTVEAGLRIDEALSIHLRDYDGIECTVEPSRSKTNTRKLALTKKTCQLIDKYIMSERADAEQESGKLCDYLFITLRPGDTQGEQLKYRNYYKALKRAARKAGLDEDMIRTHSGRSTKVMSLLVTQAEHPEKNLTDNQIRLTMGWNSLDSLAPYRDNKNMAIAKSAQQKILSRKDNKESEDK